MRTRPSSTWTSGRWSLKAGRRFTSIFKMRASANVGSTLWAAAISSTALRKDIGERSSDSTSLAPTSTTSLGRGTM